MYRAKELTIRELEMMQLLAEGLTKPKIAAKLGIEESTVKSHVENIYRKTGFHDKLQLVIWALLAGLVTSNIVIVK